MTINKGDVVGLTCGGPNMTVFAVQDCEDRDENCDTGGDAGDIVSANWFNSDDELQEAEFHVFELEQRR